MFIYGVYQFNTCIALISDLVSAVVCELYNLRFGSFGGAIDSNFNRVVVVGNKRCVLQPLCLVLSDCTGILQYVHGCHLISIKYGVCKTRSTTQ